MTVRSTALQGAFILAVLACTSPVQAGDRFSGRVVDAEGAPVVGAMVTFSAGEPAHRVTVFSDESGAFASPSINSATGLFVARVRRIGWKDLQRADLAPARHTFTLERERDPEKVAAQLPANHWARLVLDRLDDPDDREEFKRQCFYCHQQGSALTRRMRTEEEWEKLLHLMGRMGGLLSQDLRERLPALLREAYAPESAVPALTANMRAPGFGAPENRARLAIIDEWDLGGRASMQHDMTVHPDGRVYSVDMAQDMLYRLDPRAPDGARESWLLPRGDWPLGGAFATAGPPLAPANNSHVGPHSLQVAPDGAVWITLALGNELARFDPESESFSVHALDSGYYPHTLRFDARGRIWYTIAASNHLGMLDPASAESRQIRLPATSFSQRVVLRMMPLILWVGRQVDLRSAAAEGDGMNMPIPYGIDVAPDGTVFFSQLNEHRIGRVDPETFAVEMIDTPFPAPRRLRFDADGKLWIPSFSGNLVSRFDPATGEFRSWPLPVEPLGSETPYALHVERESGDVWICGTNSDSLIRFEPDAERFTQYPLPTRVTYTREIDFDREGRVWTSNSNAPAWHIEGGTPRLIRLDPGSTANADAEVARP